MKLSGLVLAVLALVAIFGISESKVDKCPTECPPVPGFKTLWTSDGTICKPLQSKCFLNKENCIRLASGQKALRVVSERTCKTKCKTMCTFQMDVVCGQLNGESKMFNSECIMENENCLTGKPYTLTFLEYCGITHKSVQTFDSNIYQTFST